MAWHLLSTSDEPITIRMSTIDIPQGNLSEYVNLIITESSEIMFFTQKLYPAMNELNCNRVIQRYCAVSSSEDVVYGKIPQSLVAARFVFKTV